LCRAEYHNCLCTDLLTGNMNTYLKGDYTNECIANEHIIKCTCNYYYSTKCNANTHNCNCNIETYNMCLAYTHNCNCKIYNDTPCLSDEEHKCNCKIDNDKPCLSNEEHDCICNNLKIKKVACLAEIHKCNCKSHILYHHKHDEMYIYKRQSSSMDDYYSYTEKFEYNLDNNILCINPRHKCYVHEHKCICKLKNSSIKKEVPSFYATSIYNRNTKKYKKIYKIKNKIKLVKVNKNRTNCLAEIHDEFKEEKKDSNCKIC